MASSTLSPATPSQLCSSKSGMFTPTHAVFVNPTRTHMVTKDKGMRIKCQATSIPADKVPDMGKRQLMNLLLLGAISLPTAGMIVPYAAFFVPPGIGAAGGGTIAKDALGNDVIAEQWLKNHGPGDRTLTQGLKGDPTYLVVEKDRTLATYAINAVCTHLGCVVPWNASEKKFVCPCHGSQYNDQGRVIRGPAPLSLALAHCDIDDGKVVFVPWAETDFRTGDAPWIGAAGGGIIANDALGNDVIAEQWLKNHGPGDRSLTQGLKGDPTYLVVEKDRTLATYGINAVCTHKGCVVPWNASENKFTCPCHGSQYNDQGRVTRGPAPLSLALAYCDIDDGKVAFVP